MSETIRTFIAISLPPEIREALDGISRALEQQTAPRAVRWVKPAGIHLTLCFLGETGITRLPELRQTLDGITAVPFPLQLGELGAFPRPRRPRVIWVGLQGDLPALQSLQQAVTAAVAPLGWQPDRRSFHPHLTLGRVKNAGGVSRLNWSQPVPSLGWRVTAVELIRSDLQPTGALYTTLHTRRL